jgi:MtN3 and saliva related transmembrane protein
MAASPAAIAVGVVAALLSITSFAPQIIKLWREKDASAVSLRTCLVTVAGFSCWTLYGAMTQAWPVIVSNLACLAMAAGVLALKWRFDRKSA